MKLDKTTHKALCTLQKREITDHLVYSRIARSKKHDTHAAILSEIAADEQKHYETWKKYTKKDFAPHRIKAAWYTLLFWVFGYTFVLRLMEQGERKAQEAYTALPHALVEINMLISDEEKHEKLLVSLLEEERLKYLGAIVLGLNDALVELSGSLAGYTFAFANTQMIAMAGIITGTAATLSMAASNYLAEKENGNPHALKASFYTGGAYLITVALLVTPYLIFPEEMYLAALALMLIAVIVVIFVFNYYVSVAQDTPFWSRFGKMTAISLGVALISFFIGLTAKTLLGIDI